jgi:hypothetical protein
MTPTWRGTVHWVSGPEPPLRTLLCPAWLLTGSRLEAQDRVSACGRDALRVAVTKRPGAAGRLALAHFPTGRAEALVDAELGILLRIAWLADGEMPDVTELVSLELDPVIDPARFAAPPACLRPAARPEDHRLRRAAPLAGVQRQGDSRPGHAAGSRR